MYNYTWATLLTTIEYLPAIVGLNYSLQKVNSKYPLTVIVLDNIYEQVFQTLHNENIQYYVVSDIYNLKDLKALSGECDIPRDASYFQTEMLYKFFIFDLKQYDKVCYLDSDILMCQNMDFIFNTKTPAAKLLDDIIEPQYAGEMFIINPHDYTTVQFLDGILHNEFDESILGKRYNKKMIVNLPLLMFEENGYFIHFHAHGALVLEDFFGKYWNENDLQFINLFYNKIDMIISTRGEKK